MGEKWETRWNSRREIGVNGKQDETRNRGKTGEKNRRKKTGKNRWEKENYKKYKKKISTRFWEVLKTEMRFDKISGNAENGNENKNKVFSNVTKRRFESKNKASVQAYNELL